MPAPFADSLKGWTNSVIACAKAGVPTKELVGNPMFSDRMGNYLAGCGQLTAMRPDYSKNQTSKKGDPAVAKKYHELMDEVKAQGMALNKTCLSYMQVVSKWSVNFKDDKKVSDLISQLGIFRNHLEAATNVSQNELFKVIKPPRPIRADKPPPIPPRPGQHLATEQDDQEDLYQTTEDNYQ